MTDPDRSHPGEPAEGSEHPGAAGESGRTPHPDQPAEGEDPGGGADVPAAG